MLYHYTSDSVRDSDPTQRTFWWYDSDTQAVRVAVASEAYPQAGTFMSPFFIGDGKWNGHAVEGITMPATASFAAMLNFYVRTMVEWATEDAAPSSTPCCVCVDREGVYPFDASSARYCGRCAADLGLTLTAAE